MGVTALLVIPLTSTVPAGATEPAVPFDLNGDGRAEVVTGLPTWDSSAVARDSGAVLVLWGGRNRVEETLLAQDGAAVPGDPAPGDRFGAAVGSADLDRDGFADLVVGAPGDAADVTGTSGSVTVFYGSATGVGARVEQVLHGPNSAFGAAIVASDLTGDGTPDVAVGSPGSRSLPGSGSGAVVVLDGGAAGLSMNRSYVVSRPDPAMVGFGSELAVGDVDGDGNLDLAEGYGGDLMAEGAPVPGHVTVAAGSSGGPRTARLLSTTAAASIDVGDITGDGLDDVVIGTPLVRPFVEGRPMPRGRISLFRGAAEGLSATPVQASQSSPGVPGRNEPGDLFGASIDLVDLDLDGRLDVLVGAPGEDRGSGRLTVVRGARLGFAQRHNIVMDQGSPGIPSRPERSDAFGQEVTAVDVNGDQRRDLVIGSPGENGFRGSVTVVRLRGIFYVPQDVRAYSLESLDRRAGGPQKMVGAVLGGE